MQNQKRLRIAIQKKGRLNNDSIDLLTRCGMKFQFSKSTLFCHCENLPIDLLFVRDDDIPTLVMDDICDLGIVGENVLFEQELYQKTNGNVIPFEVLKKLGFSSCRLSIAVPQEDNFNALTSLHGKRIATSYPHILGNFLYENKLDAEILTISGSVEVAPRLAMADAICDLVSTGRTLEENNLKEVQQVITSEAVLIKTKAELVSKKAECLELLLRRIDGVQAAQESKYIMFHILRSKVDEITNLLPGAETPTIMSLEANEEKVAVHTVSREAVFWQTLEKLKKAGASSILVLPIEKMLC